MEIKKGGTRIIFIFHRYVVKIPRIKWILICEILIKHLFSKDPFGIVEGHNHKLFFVIKSYIIVGFFANMRESKYSKNNKNANDPLLKAKSLFFGFIEIQEKGQSLYSKNNPRWKRLKKMLQKNKIRDCDSLTHKNFSLFNNKIYMHDYGGPSTISEIEKVLRILRNFNKLQTP